MADFRSELLGSTSWRAIMIAQAFPDAMRVKVRRAWSWSFSWHPDRPFGYAGVAFGWALTLVVAVGGGVAVSWLLVWGFFT